MSFFSEEIASTRSDREEARQRAESQQLSDRALFNACLSRAHRGDAYAQYEVGRNYFNGYPIPQDYQRAYHYLTLAVQQNIYPAVILLGRMYQEALGRAQDLQVAEGYYLSAVDYVKSEAAYRLANLYMQMNSEDDYLKALPFLKTAIKHENEEAKELLIKQRQSTNPYVMSENAVVLYAKYYREGVKEFAPLLEKAYSGNNFINKYHAALSGAVTRVLQFFRNTPLQALVKEYPNEFFSTMMGDDSLSRSKIEDLLLEIETVLLSSQNWHVLWTDGVSTAFHRLSGENKNRLLYELGLLYIDRGAVDHQECARRALTYFSHVAKGLPCYGEAQHHLALLHYWRANQQLSPMCRYHLFEAQKSIPHLIPRLIEDESHPQTNYSH